MLDVISLLSVLLGGSPEMPPTLQAGMVRAAEALIAEAPAPSLAPEAAAEGATRPGADKPPVGPVPAGPPAGTRTLPKPVSKVECALRVAQKGSASVLTAYALSHGQARAGRYELQVGKTGGIGLATIRQGSKVGLPSDKEKVLGTISLGAGDGYTAKLSVSWGDDAARARHTVTCSQDQPGAGDRTGGQLEEAAQPLSLPDPAGDEDAPALGGANRVSIEQRGAGSVGVLQRGHGNTIQVRQSH